MHTENLLAIRQTLGYSAPALEDAAELAAEFAVDPGFAPRDVEVPAGTYRVGAERDARFVHDNEKWAHDVELDGFAISNLAVTNAEFARFVDAGGNLVPFTVLDANLNPIPDPAAEIAPIMTADGARLSFFIEKMTGQELEAGRSSFR